ncbi:MAG TPA: sugar ABC transporter permease [Chloroflexota bacterium]|nr:sugar ABC transporter permease [Chloroflexota bacterium]
MATTTGRLPGRWAGAGLANAWARRGTQEGAEARLGLLLAAPAFVTILLIAVIPLAQTILDSLFQISLKFENAPRPFVGLDNYGSALSDDSWFNALRVTGLVAGASVAAELVLGMIIALLINHAFRGRGLVRAAVLVPWALTTVVSAKMWAWIYDGRYGIANDLLMRLHLIDQPIIFLVRPEITIWAMVAAEIWKTTPFMALILLAGLQLIAQELYEAAALDGASRWQAFWRVTLPILRPTILVALLFRTIDAVRMFDLPRVLTNGGPGRSTETVVLYAYNTFFTSLNFGYGSTLAVVIFLIVTCVSFIFIKVLGAPTQGARR